MPISAALRLGSSCFQKVAAIVISNHSRSLSSKVSFSFIESKTGNKVTVEGEVGKSVLDVAVAHDIDIEGACGGELACSTCHVICEQELYDILPLKKEEEDDMLDLAWGLKATSRLCCQLKVAKNLEGAEFTVPTEI